MTVIGVPIITLTVGGILGDLITECRKVVKDTVTAIPSEVLWTDDEWVEYFVSGENEICERAHVLEDSSTASICTITMVDGTASYSLSSTIIFIKNIIPSWNLTAPLVKRTEDWLDINYAGWRNLDDGTPEFAIERQTDSLQLVPPPNSDIDAETLALTVIRRPKTALSASNTTPEIALHLYDDLKYWALYRAFSKHDAEIDDEQKATQYAKYYYELFERRVGTRPDANTARIMKQEPNRGIQIAPFRR